MGKKKKKIAKTKKCLEEDKGWQNEIEWEWKGNQEDQVESQVFLGKAFLVVFVLIFVILLPKFN